MRKDTIKKAVKELNKSIRFYQRKLTYQLELKAEKELGNGNVGFCSLLYDYNPELIEKYEIIIADLATIKRAVKNNEEYVNIIGSPIRNGFIYAETSKSLSRAGIDYDDGYIYYIEGICEEMEDNGRRFPIVIPTIDDSIPYGFISTKPVSCYSQANI